MMRDAARAKVMYEQEIEKDGDVNGMVRVGKLVAKGADGIATDALHAPDLFVRAL